MSDDGQRTGRQDAALRYVGSLRCRPVAGATADPAPEGWRFDILQAGAGVVVTEVAGEIDLRTVGILRKRLFELTEAGFARIIIDFEHVRFCDAAGLGALVAAQNRLRGGHDDGHDDGGADGHAGHDGRGGDLGAAGSAGSGEVGARHQPGEPGEPGQAGQPGQGGSISLARVRPAQRRLLRVAGLDKAFALYDSVPDAVRAQRDPAGAPLG